MMVRYLYALFPGLVGAAIIHLAIVFLLPSLSANSSWNFVRSQAEILQPLSLTPEAVGENRALKFDPLVESALCRFDLSDGAVRLDAVGNALFWSVAAFDTTGTAFFSANKRIVDSDDFDLIVLTPEQLRVARQINSSMIEDAILATTSDVEGFVKLRVLRPDASWSVASKEMLDTLRCEQINF